MKTPPRIFLSCLLFTAAAAVHAAPVIINITRTADPGDLIAIQGEGFGTDPTVNVSDGVTSTINLTLANGGIINHDDQGTLISAKIPSDSGLVPGKIYTVTVTAAGSSGTKQINVPEIRGYLDLAGLQITPSRSFRIYGDNLYMPGLTTSVFLNQGANSYPCTLVGTPTDRFVITATTPANLPTSGTFTVFVRAGGVTTGFGVAGAQTLTGRVNGNDVWGLGVPWGADFAPFYSNKGATYNVKTAYGATGNGTTNDAAAIQNAINAANAAGGGTVYLPSGTYNVVNSTILVKANVVLQGDGQNLTTIKTNSSTAPARPVTIDGNLAGLVDLRVLVDTGVGATVAIGREVAYSNAKSKIFALRCTFDQYKPAQSTFAENFALRWENANQIVIKNCTTYVNARSHSYGNVVLQGCRDLLLAGNTFTYRTSRIWLDGGPRVQVEGNTVNMCNDRIVHTDNAGGFRFGLVDNAVFLNNTFQKLDVLGNNAPMPYYNDGECIMTEICNTTTFGTATGGTSNTLIDTTKSFASMAGQWIFITLGPGAGQSRKIASSSGTTITISGTWEITPTAGSVYSISNQVVENSLVKDNTMHNLPVGVAYYDVHLLGSAVVNNSMTNCTGIYYMGFQYDSNSTRGTAKDIVVEDNSIVDADKVYAARINLETFSSVSASLGNMYYGATIYNNLINAFTLGANSTWKNTGEGYVLHVTNPAINRGIPGPLFDRNQAIDCDTAIRVAGGAQNVTFWNATYTNCGKPVDRLNTGFGPMGAAVSPFTMSSNLALFRPVSIIALSSQSHLPAVDGDLATFWQTTNGSPKFLRVDLGSSKSIDRVKLTWENSSLSTYYPTAYTIQVSPDGLTNWTILKTVTGGTGGVADFAGLNGTGRYVKVNITGFKASACRLYEMEVYAP